MPSRKKRGIEREKRDCIDVALCNEGGSRWADSGTLCERAWGTAGRHGAGVLLGTGRSWRWWGGQGSWRHCASLPQPFISHMREVGQLWGQRYSYIWEPPLNELYSLDYKKATFQNVIYQKCVTKDEIRNCRDIFRPAVSNLVTGADMRLVVVSFVFFENYDNSTCSYPLTWLDVPRLLIIIVLYYNNTGTLFISTSITNYTN